MIFYFFAVIIATTSAATNNVYQCTNGIEMDVDKLGTIFTTIAGGNKTKPIYELTFAQFMLKLKEYTYKNESLSARDVK